MNRSRRMGGWHVIELLDIREMDRTEEAIRAEARDKIMRRKADQEIDERSEAVPG